LSTSETPATRPRRACAWREKTPSSPTRPRAATPAADRAGNKAISDDGENRQIRSPGRSARTRQPNLRVRNNSDSSRKLRFCQSATVNLDVVLYAPLVMSIWSASIGNNVRRADSSSLPRPYCHFELQRGPSPNIAHSSFASPESPLAQVGMWVISSAVAEQRTGALPQLSFCYFACPTLSRAADARQKTRLWGLSADEERRRSVCFGGITTAAGAPEANRFLRRDCIAPPCTGKPRRGGLTRAPGPPSCLARPPHHYLSGLNKSCEAFSAEGRFAA
jgi:hypothetical protein